MSDAIEKLDRRTVLGPQIYNRLRQAIVETELLPGMLLSESEIARRYEVSRQPVREAFIKLAQAGLVRVLPQRGTMVTRISESEIRDSRFLREAIEADIVRAVALQGDGAVVAELERQIEVQRGVHRGDLRVFLQMDDLFHRTLTEAAGNQTAWFLLEDLKAQIDRVRYLSLENMHIADLIVQHQAVVSGIAARDPDAAERAMRIHLREILRSTPAFAEQKPELFESLPPSAKPAIMRD